MNFNITDIDASLLPDVFLTKILLETSSTPQEVKGAQERLFGKGRPWAKNPAEGNSGSSPSSTIAPQDRSLKITLSLTIMDFIDENGLTSWFYNEDLTKYLTIRIIQSQSEEITESLRKGTFSALQLPNNKKYFDIKDIPVKKTQEPITNFSSINSSSGRRVFNIDYRVNFIINDLEPYHLSYFAFCYLDLKALINDYNMGFLLPDGDPTTVRGTVVGDRVIHDGILQLETYQYLFAGSHSGAGITSGQIWTGPVHQVKPNQAAQGEQFNATGGKSSAYNWKTGATTSSDSKYLIRRKVANNKIQDYRELDTIKLMDFDLVPAKNIFSQFEKGKRGSQRVIQNAPEVYFSDAFLSYSEDGGSKFLFQLDYNRILRDNTQFGSIFDQASNPESLQQIYKLSPILSLKVLRRRVDIGIANNRLGSPVKGQIKVHELSNEKLIVTSGDKNGILRETINPPRMKHAKSGDKEGRPIKKYWRAASNLRSRNETDPIIGAIKETPPILGTTFRTFTVSDWSAQHITDGYYQYGIQIEIKDGTIDFLNRQMKRIIEIKQDLDSYYSVASMPTSYNEASGRFEDNGKKIKTYYRSVSLPKKPWVKSIAIFIDILTSLTTINEPNALAIRLLSFLNPSTTSLEGINAFINLVAMLETKIINILGPKLRDDVGTSTKQWARARFKPSVITLTRYFNETWNSNERSDIGLDYLAVPNISNGIGLKGITTKDFIKRVEQETEMYWNGKNAKELESKIGNTKTAGITPEIQGILDISQREYSYLTVGTCHAGNGDVIQRTGKGIGPSTMPQYDALTCVYVGISTGEIEPPRPSPQRGTQDTNKMSTAGTYARDELLSKLGIVLLENTITQYEEINGQEYDKSSQKDPGMVAVSDILGPLDLQVRENLESRGRSGCDHKILDNDLAIVDQKATPISLMVLQNVVANGNLRNVSPSGPVGFKSAYESTPPFSLQMYDLNRPDNVLAKLINTYKPLSPIPSAEDQSITNETSLKQTPPPLTSYDYRIIFDQVPNQIVSLFLSRNEAVTNNWADTDVDLPTNIETSEYFRYNYNMIAKVEVLTGYNTTNTFSGTRGALASGVTGKNISLMMSPKFQSLKKEHLQRLPSGKLLLCRFRQYQNKILGIGTSPGISVKYFDQYFLLSGTQEGLQTIDTVSTPDMGLDALSLSRMSVGHRVLGSVEDAYKSSKKISSSFQSNIRVQNGSSRQKLEII